ncbi:MAG: hypothetical protein ABEI06_00275 [Halobacteriaceae archaeon]
MNLDRLRSVQQRERETDSLQELSDSFYEDVAAYIADLKEKRQHRAQEVDDPFSNEEINQLTDEIETAEQVAKAIYERRIGKIVKQASFTAAEMGQNEPTGLTAEEQELYQTIVERIQENKSHVLDILTKQDTQPPQAEDDSEEDAGPSTTDRGDESSNKGSSEVSIEARDDSENRMTVRVTQDIGEIFGVDERVYTLEADDIVQLPEPNAQPLVERDAAEKIEDEDETD